MPRILVLLCTWVLTVSAGAALPGLDVLLSREAQLMRRAAQKPKDPELIQEVAELRAQISYREAGKGDVDAAAAYLQNSLSLSPEHADRWTMLGDLYQLVGAPGARHLAEEAYEKSLALDPKRVLTRARLGALFLSQGRFLKAMDQFEVLIEGEEAQTPQTEYLQPLAAAYAAAQENGRGARFFERMAKKGGGPAFKTAAAVLHWNSHEDIPLVGPLKRRSALKLIKEVETEAAGTALGIYAVRLRHSWENEASK